MTVIENNGDLIETILLLQHFDNIRREPKYISIYISDICDLIFEGKLSILIPGIILYLIRCARMYVDEVLVI